MNVQPIDQTAARIIGDAAGAFVFTLAIAGTEQHFKERVAAEFHEDGFAVFEWDEIIPFDLSTTEFEAETRDCFASISPEHPVQYARFDSYPREGLNA